MKLKDKISGLLTSKTFVWSALLIALFISATLCATQVIRFIQYRQALNAPVIQPVESIAPTIAPTPSPTATPEIMARKVEDKPVNLELSSSELDLIISVKDENGEQINGENFILRVKAAGKEKHSTYFTNTEGNKHIINMPEGECTVSFEAQKGYAASVASIEVKGEILREVVEITEPVASVEEVLEETKTNTASGGEISIGDINTNDEESKVESIVTPSQPSAPPTVEEPGTPSGDGFISFDSPGVAHNYSTDSYIYTIYTDNDGYILANGGAESSNAMYIEEDGGRAVYGLIMTETSSEAVELVYADGSVNTAYQIFSQAVSSPIPDETPDDTPAPKIGWQQENGKTYYYLSDESVVKGLNRIDGKLYFFHPETGAKASSLGIDVSYFNNSIDWNAVKNDGIEFAIIRVGGRGWSTGLLYDDTMAYQNLANAKAAGIKIGVYFYSTAITVEEAVQEASLAIQNLHGVPLDFPIYFDTEDSGEYPYGRSDLLTPEQQTEIARAFCDTVINSGYRAGVYSGLNYFYSHINYGALTSYDIWLANYTRNYALPNFAGRYDMWQFTDSGRVSGIVGYVDMDVIF